ncbi:hypothetical protein PALB_12750 [Pseudoalteromonas luteoviolacea B = ATCC 29581]|nr:hypothetical protein PALB_12750 [Pseudoalteromonas luteoviolacea B = ATCC 29581]
MKKILGPVHAFSQRIGLVRVRSFWHSLNFAQRCYLSAFLLVFISSLISGFPANEVFELTFENGFVNLGLFIALIGLVVEFWPRFHHFWESLPGKAIILLFYAFVANYALVQSSGMINDITGLNADHFPYSHNLALLLSVPSWFTVTTLFVFILAQLALPLYLITLVLLKPFGISEFLHAPHYRFPVTTGILRYGFSIIIFVAFVSFTESSGLSKSVSETVTGIVQGLDGVVNIETPENSENLDTTEGSNVDKDVRIGITINVGGENEDHQASSPTISEEHIKQFQERKSQIEKKGEAYNNHIKQFVANFIYLQEADERSRCAHSEKSRVVELNDFEIVEITKDPTQPFRYRFEVKPCISAAIGHQFQAKEKSLAENVAANHTKN